ncbi:ferritin family protein [Chloroflexota bacterium]
MSITFSDNELINIAIGIERRGVAFYEVMARSARDNNARKVFALLADMERGHIETFQGMLREGNRPQVAETYAGEYAAYLGALVDSAVFTDDMASSEMATRAESDIAALELAIAGEKDSLLFYYGMKEIMPPPAQSTVDNVINEEKLHLRQLAELKSKLAAQ